MDSSKFGLGWKEPLETTQPNSPAVGRGTRHQTVLLKAPSNPISNDGDNHNFSGNVFPCLSTFIAKNLFLQPKPTLFWFRTASPCPATMGPDKEVFLNYCFKCPLYITGVNKEQPSTACIRVAKETPRANSIPIVTPPWDKASQQEGPGTFPISKGPYPTLHMLCGLRVHGRLHKQPGEMPQTQDFSRKEVLSPL